MSTTTQEAVEAAFETIPHHMRLYASSVQRELAKVDATIVVGVSRYRELRARGPKHSPGIGPLTRVHEQELLELADEILGAL